MKNYITKLEQVKYFDSLTCDRCKKQINDSMQLQEAISLQFTGGYDSVFDDGATVEVDLCQDCLKDLIGEFCRIK